MPLVGLPSPVEFLLKGLLCAGELISWESHGGENEVIVTLKFSAPGDVHDGATGSTSSCGKTQTNQTHRDVKGKGGDSFKDHRHLEHKRPFEKFEQENHNVKPRPLDHKGPFEKFEQENHNVKQHHCPEQSRYSGLRPNQQQQGQYRGSNSPLSAQQHGQQQHHQVQQQRHQQQQLQQQQRQQQQRQQQAMPIPIPMMPMTLPIHMMHQQGPRMAQMANFNKSPAQYQGNVYGFTCYNKNRPGQMKPGQDKREHKDQRDHRPSAGNSHTGGGVGNGSTRSNSAANQGKGKQQQPLKQKQQGQHQQQGSQMGQQNKYNKKQPVQQTPQQGQQNKYNKKQQPTLQQQPKEQSKELQQNKQHNKQQLKLNKKQIQRQQKQQASHSAKHSTDDGEGSNSAEETNYRASGDWSEQMDEKSPLGMQAENTSTDSTEDDSGFPQRRSPDARREYESPVLRMKSTDGTSSSAEFLEPESIEVGPFKTEPKGSNNAINIDATVYKDPNLIEKIYQGAISVPCLVKQLSSNQCSHMIEPDENYFLCGECGNAYCKGCAQRGLANPRSAVPACIFPCFKGHAIHTGFLE